MNSRQPPCFANYVSETEKHCVKQLLAPICSEIERRATRHVFTSLRYTFRSGKSRKSRFSVKQDAGSGDLPRADVSDHYQTSDRDKYPNLFVCALMRRTCFALFFFFPFPRSEWNVFGVHLSIKTKGQEKTNKMIRLSRTEASPSVCKHALQDCSVLAPPRLHRRVCRSRHFLSTNIILKQTQTTSQISRRREKSNTSRRSFELSSKVEGKKRDKLPRVYYFFFFALWNILTQKAPMSVQHFLRTEHKRSKSTARVNKRTRARLYILNLCTPTFLLYIVGTGFKQGVKI